MTCTKLSMTVPCHVPHWMKPCFVNLLCHSEPQRQEAEVMILPAFPGTCLWISAQSFYLDLFFLHKSIYPCLVELKCGFFDLLWPIKWWRSRAVGRRPCTSYQSWVLPVPVEQNTIHWSTIPGEDSKHLWPLHLGMRVPKENTVQSSTGWNSALLMCERYRARSASIVCDGSPWLARPMQSNSPMCTPLVPQWKDPHSFPTEDRESSEVGQVPFESHT